MNKSQLIEIMASKTGESKAGMARAVDAFIEAVSETVSKGDTLSLVGFGTFGVRNRAARTGRNPRTGEEIKIEAARLPNFKAGKAFKEQVNK